MASKITIKLLLDASSRKVLFGEAGKDFIDFMFSLLTLPLGSVINLLSPQKMVGSIGKLYQSIGKLNDTYFISNETKFSLLRPKISTSDIGSPLLLGNGAIAESLCGNCKRKVTAKNNFKCSYCSSTLGFSFNGAGRGGQSVGGFVQGVMIYMITDDLEVTPMSAISSITLINQFMKKKDAQIQEKVVTVGMKEGLALLKASLMSTTVLTDIFYSSENKRKAPSDDSEDDYSSDDDSSDDSEDDDYKLKKK